MSYEPSAPIETLAEAPADVRDRAMTALIELCLRELFEFRMMQTDPNFANYRWRPETGQIVLLDFGATREIGQASRPAIWICCMPGSRATGTACLPRWRGSASSGPGWRSITARRCSTWPGWASQRSTGRLISPPTTCPTGCAGAAWRSATSGSCGTSRPPRRCFLQRKIGGLYLLAARLGATVDFPALLARWA
jgi:hypothetical protein